jgi:type 1 glutamine amidotransferase
MMNRKTQRLALLILVAACSACTSDPGPGPESPRVLVFSRTMGYRHASIEPGIEAIRRIGEEAGFDVDATEDPSVFEADRLERYAAVVFLSTSDDVLDEAQQQAFAEYIRGGGGFAGVHGAADTEYDWRWYGRLVGAYFSSHPNDPNVREGTLHVVDRDHASTRGLPDPWIRRDEWYDFGELEPGLNVLLDVDESSYKRPAENPAPAPRPMAWLHSFDGGRAWYTGLGHTSASFSEPAFLEHLAGGLRYAIGADRADGAPPSGAGGS